MRPDDLAAAIVRAALDKVPSLDPHEIDDLLLGLRPAGRRAGLQPGPRRRRLPRLRRAAGGDHHPLLLLLAADDSDGDACDPGRRGRCVRLGRRRNRVPVCPRNSDPWPGTHNPIFAEAEERSVEAAQGGTTWHDPREDGLLPNIYLPMGQTAENLAQLKGITREDMDHFGVRSQNLAEQAIAAGFWAREITPVTTPSGKVVSADDGPRPGVTYDAVSQLKPVFRPDGRITAGNCCPLNDGAAALVVMSDRKAAELGITPLARIIATAVSALSPEIMGLGPVEATGRVLARAGMTIDDVDLVEINEAFAAQVIPSYRELGIDLDRLNVNGGAIALGHPFGMTGARITTTLINSLQWHDKQIGLETMCVGGGQGMAMLLERLS